MKKKTEILSNPWTQRIGILLVIVIVMARAESKFFRLSNVMSILSAIAIYGIMCGGMLFVVLVGGIDLSIGSVGAIGACICAMITVMVLVSIPSEYQQVFRGVIIIAAVAAGEYTRRRSIRTPINKKKQLKAQKIKV